MCGELDTTKNKLNVLLFFLILTVLCIVAGIGVQFDKYMTDGDMGGGGLNTQHRKKKLTTTTSPQEKSTKHRHHKTYF